MAKGRPRKELTDDQIRQLSAMAGLGLTNEAMAAILGMSVRTFERRALEDDAISDALEKGRAKANLQLAKTAFDMATSGKDTAMTIFMCKVRLGWKEAIKLEHTGADGGPLDVRHLTEAEIDEEAARLCERLKPKGA